MRYLTVLLICIAVLSGAGWVSDGGWDQGIENNRQYGNIVPATDNTYSIGSATKSWANLYIDGDIYTDGNISIIGGTAIGIGTTAPQTALEVIGTAKATNLSVNVVAPTAKVDILNSGSESLFKLGNSASGDVITIPSTGSVGIGTATPRAKLDVEGNVYFKGTMIDVTLYTASAGSGGSKTLRISADGTIYAF